MTQDRYTQGQYLRDNPTWHTEDAAWKARTVLQMLREHALVPKTICEVGCGAVRFWCSWRKQEPRKTYGFLKEIFYCLNQVNTFGTMTTEA